MVCTECQRRRRREMGTFGAEVLSLRIQAFIKAQDLPFYVSSVNASHTGGRLLFLGWWSPWWWWFWWSLWWGGFWCKSCGCPSPNRHRFLVKLVRGAVSGGGAALVLMPLSWLGLHPPLVEASPAPPPLHQRRTQCYCKLLQQPTASYCKQLHATAVRMLCRSAVGAANKCKCCLIQVLQVFPPGQCTSVPSWTCKCCNCCKCCKCSLLGKHRTQSSVLHSYTALGFLEEAKIAHCTCTYISHLAALCFTAI